MGKIVIRITPHTYPRNKDIEQLIAYISGKSTMDNKGYDITFGIAD